MRVLHGRGFGTVDMSRDRQGNVVGAVSVSGSTVENDHAVAVAGAEALGE